MTKREAWAAIWTCLMWVLLVAVAAWLLSGCTSIATCSCEAQSGEECRAVTECASGDEVREPPVKPPKPKKPGGR